MLEEIVSIEYIADCIRQAGLDPKAQLMGYLQTEDACYITRTGNARSLIENIHEEKIRKYIQKNGKGTPSL